MKRSITIVTISAVIVAATIGGYWVGFRSGIELAHGSHATETGAVAVAELDLLEAGRIDKAKLFLEAGVDDGLIGWSDLTSTRARLSAHIFGSGLPSYDDERFVRLLAQYRKAHASPWAVPVGVDAVKATAPDSDELLNWHPLKERDAKIATVVERYAP